MKPSVTWCCACVVSALSVVAACSSDPTPTGTGHGGAPGGGGATPSAGAAGIPGTAGSTAAGAGGTPGTAGSTSAGAGGTPGTAGAGGGSAGVGGGSAGAANTGFKCPAGPFEAPALDAKKASKIPGAPPADSFNNNGNGFTNVEGPVWIGDSLYFSEMTGADLPPARILKIAPGNVVSIAVPDSGSNGLAVDASGNLLAAVHKDGSVSQVALPSGMETPLVTGFGQPPVRFNSPNDLAIRNDGTIYFSDPNYQNNANPQKAERLYRIGPAPTRTVSVATNASDTAYLRPNGVTLSLDEKTLYVSGSGLKKFAVMADGTLGVGSEFAVGQSGDGMVLDCAGNLYVAGGSNMVKVFSPTGMQLGTISTDMGTTTNVAFGGADHKMLYITVQGSNNAQGVYSVAMNVPGFPY